MICSVANKQDKPALYSLWQSAFGDDKKTVDTFFENAVSLENALVVRKNGEAVSALYIIPARLFVSGKSYKAGYIYAAATFPEHRKKGYMSKLLDFAREHAEQNGFDLLFLKPDSEYLYKYYEKNGYRTALYSYPLTSFENINPDRAMIVWDKNIEMLDRSFCGDEAFFGESGYAVYSRGEEKIIIDYFSSAHPDRLLEEMKNTFQTKNIYAPFSDDFEKRKKEGMILPINSEINCIDNIYLGITLE